MQRLAEALNVHKDDPLLHVYTSTQDKLDAMVKQYNQEVQKVCTNNNSSFFHSKKFRTNRWKVKFTTCRASSSWIDSIIWRRSENRINNSNFLYKFSTKFSRFCAKIATIRTWTRFDATRFGMRTRASGCWLSWVMRVRWCGIRYRTRIEIPKRRMSSLQTTTKISSKMPKIWIRAFDV